MVLSGTIKPWINFHSLEGSGSRRGKIFFKKESKHWCYRGTLVTFKLYKGRIILFLFVTSYSNHSTVPDSCITCTGYMKKQFNLMWWNHSNCHSKNSPLIYCCTFNDRNPFEADEKLIMCIAEKIKVKGR